ncbi:LysE family translocator [uncultured Demequina sp.]|uniref:LysE family translocator n=1 Tax=uncultured Demequina sp. TaxID=693499 RepID=UPI0025EE957C|nr:LysE family translocator [uncultured Demequina sp.]
MIAPDTLLAFVALSFVVIVIPGPSVLFIVGRALQHGRREALLSVIGNAGGEVVHAVLVAVGIGAIIAASATAFTVLKIVGGAYLVYLGIQAIRHRRDGLDVGADAGVAPAAPSRRVLAESFVVGVTNPKTLVFVAAVLPQFVDPERGPAWAQILVLGLVFAVIAIISDGAYALLASGARTWFARSPRRIAGVRAAGGTMMAALGVALLVTRRTA